MTTKPATVATLTSELQNFSPFTALEDGAPPAGPAAEGVGGDTADRSFRPRPLCSTPGAPAAPEGPRPGTNGGALDYGPYYAPAQQFYSGLAKEQSVDSQDSSTLSSPPSDSLAPPPAPVGPASAPDSLFQFSIGKILEDERAGTTPEVQGTDRELSGFYTEGSGTNRTQSPQLHPPEKADPEGTPTEPRQIRRSVHL